MSGEPQRYAPYEADFGVMVMQSDGEFVTYDEAKAWVEREVKAAEQRVMDAVKAAYPCRCLQPQPLDGHWGYCPRMEVVPALAAIDALRTEKS